MTNILTFFVFSKLEDGSRETEAHTLLIFKTLVMKFKFEKLIIWQKSMDLGDEIHLIKVIRLCSDSVMQ